MQKLNSDLKKILSSLDNNITTENAVNPEFQFKVSTYKTGFKNLDELNLEI
jgi:hypothetical protein